MYIIKKFDQSPFNQDGVGKDVFILCKKETGEAIAEIAPNMPWYVKEGDDIEIEDVKLDERSKKSKHLVVGDKVIAGNFEGEVEKIELFEADCWDWNDIIHLKNCKLNLRLRFLSKEKIEETQKIKRSECKPKPYLLCEFIFSEEKKWDKFRQEWITFHDDGPQATKEFMKFCQERVQIK